MTIAQQLKVKEFPFEIKDSKSNQIYYENSNGFWVKGEWDSKANLIYCEDSTGYWAKREWDSMGNVIYYENSNGDIEDNRPKTELTLKEISSKFNIPLDKLRIKD